MNSTEKKISARQAWTDWLVILVFAVLLWLPTADYFGHVDWSQPPEENRMLAPAPRWTQWSDAGIRNYVAGTEKYFNDHFGFRKRLIRWCQQWKARIYRTKSENLVIIGQNGWFYASERRMIEHFLGTEKFTPQQLQSWQRLLEKRRNWLAARGIKYLFIVPPDKQMIYPEHLPQWLQNAVSTNRQTKLDQFEQYMREHSTVDVLDVRETLREGKKIMPTYLRNDTHWNLFGGFLASQEVVKALSRDTPGLPTLRMEDFDWTNRTWSGGDLPTLMGIHPPEINYFGAAPKPPLIAPEIRGLTNIVRIWFPYDTKKVNYLVVNTNLALHPVDAVIFHDSFACAWQPFLGYSFHRIVFIWENHEFNAKIIEENHPQIVINEMLERFFNTEDPDEMIARDALP